MILTSESLLACLWRAAIYSSPRSRVSSAPVNSAAMNQSQSAMPPACNSKQTKTQEVHLATHCKPFSSMQLLWNTTWNYTFHVNRLFIHNELWAKQLALYFRNNNCLTFLEIFTFRFFCTVYLVAHRHTKMHWIHSTQQSREDYRPTNSAQFITECCMARPEAWFGPHQTMQRHRQGFGWKDTWRLIFFSGIISDTIFLPNFIFVKF